MFYNSLGELVHYLGGPPRITRLVSGSFQCLLFPYRCSALTESQRLQSLLVTAQYLAHLNPEVADRVIDVAHGNSPSMQVLECRTHGTQTVQFLFSMGAEFLMK